LIAKRFLDTNQMVFLDESSARTDMTRSYGWSPSCQRCHFSVPNGYWKNVTMLSAIRQSGLIKEATLAIEGAMTRDVFEGYIESMLGPSLRAGDVVIMDNLPAHKGGQVESLIESFGASVWYLPPYSPDLNPIELVVPEKVQSCRSYHASLAIIFCPKLFGVQFDSQYVVFASDIGFMCILVEWTCF
jgi:transposase